MRRLKQANRWLIATSAALTALFTALAANAFPGRKLSSPTPTSGHAGKVSSPSQSSSRSSAESLKPPRRAPQSVPTQTQSEPAVSTESSREQGTSEETSSPTEQSTPTTTQSEPTQSVEPTQNGAETSAPVQETPAVVSGGS